MTSPKRIDTLVVGGGPGGTPTAMALARAGRKVLLVEKGAGLGGTCLFEGCIPSKIFWESSRRLRELRALGTFGIRAGERGEPDLDWAVIMERKHSILSRRAAAAMKAFEAIASLDYVHGSATLIGPRRAKIFPEQGDSYELDFSTAVLATGSVPNPLPIPGIDSPRVLTSEGLLEIEAPPRSMVVIGGGPIGVEMAQIFRGFGTRITLLEAAPRILGPVDQDLALALERHMSEADGIEMHLSARVSAIRHEKDGVAVVFENARNESSTAYGERVLEVTGRHPHVAGLGLEKTGVRFDRHGIKVNGRLETDEPGIYAVGDVVGNPMFAHWATAQGLALARHLLGAEARFPTPAESTAVIFSTPEIAIAGLTETAARQAGLDIGVATYHYAKDARAQVAGTAEGMLKLVFEAESHRIVGAHALVEGASGNAGEAAILVDAGLSLESVAAAIHPHPTLSESFGMLAREVLASLDGGRA